VSVPVGTCAFGHLIYIGQRCHQCEFEIMVARIMNQGFEEQTMKCEMGCGRDMRSDWNYCPFCGHQRAFNPGNPQATASEQAAQGQYEKSAEVISSEEQQFNTALNTVRETFDKLKRSRKLRERAEKELKEAVGKIHESDSRIHLLQQNLDSIQRPAPFAIRNVYGQLPGSKVQEVLGIVRIDQGYPVCDITVRLPR
jgi:hypothetical protein